ncbi:protein NYNRIN-like [Mycteria americana]|uniref:protein NYNRIN-like n=1 Tax=Mycteria americana TaxID=33587 RepID=UPI003F58F606
MDNQNEWPNLRDPKAIYEKDSTAEEKKQWEKREAEQSDSGIWTIAGKPILPKKYLITVARWFHDKAHGGAEAVANQVRKIWTAPGIYAAAKRITSSCPTCQKFSSIKLSSELGGRSWAYFPFQRLQIDYADMLSVSGYKHILVIVDQLSRWVEAFPTRKAHTGGVIKALLKEIIPRYGVPESTESDRGAHFTANIISQLCKLLGIERNLHTPYHAQSPGQVEGMNRTLKEKIAKISTNTGLRWLDALHLALWDVQNAPRQPIGLTPAEILFGRHLAMPGTYILAKTSLLDGGDRLTQYIINVNTVFVNVTCETTMPVLTTVSPTTLHPMIIVLCLALLCYF